MTSVENPLTKIIQVAFRKYLGLFSIAETLPKHWMLQTSQSGKVREGSGKGNGKVETDLSKHRSPGRSGKDPGR